MDEDPNNTPNVLGSDHFTNVIIARNHNVTQTIYFTLFRRERD